jgi:hypothetical protein
MKHPGWLNAAAKIAIIVPRSRAHLVFLILSQAVQKAVAINVQFRGRDLYP